MAVLEASTLRRRRRATRHGRALLALAAVLALLAGALTVRSVLHEAEVLPGVRVLGVDVAGLTAAEAGLEIRGAVARRLAEPVVLAVEGREVRVDPRRLYTLDREASAAAALAAGRESLVDRARALLAPLTGPVDVRPVLVVRPAAEQRLRAALKPFAREPVSASVAMDGLEPVVASARAGSTPDTAALVAAIAERVLADESTAVPVAFERAAPAVDDAAATAAAAEVRTLVSAPVALTFEGAAVGTLAPARLARLLRFRERDGRLLVLLDDQALARALDPAIAPHKTRATNARFEVDGTRARVVPSRAGTTLDAAAASVAVLTAAHAEGERTAALSLTAIPAEITTQELAGLGVTERISSFTTDMGPSSSNRIHNVHLMADYIDGTVVKPGEVFSFNGSVGPRTPERGFLEGQMIVGSLLLPSIGGGVCQTATTLFNNAWELGLPIVERHNHSFYISHYPLGRDATVSWGGPDFKFRNDMESAILIKAGYTDSTLTFSFYGTSEGRRVTTREGAKSNWTQPKLTYALDPAAPPGSVRVERGSHQSGFDVTVHRTVKRADGSVLREDSVTSHYIPVGDTAIYGPGRSIPGPYFVIPTT